MDNRERLSNLIGLTQRAGKIISDEELVIKAIQSGKAQFIFLANDTGADLIKKTTDKCQYYKVEVSTVFNALGLGTALGKPHKVVAIADAGFSKKMRTPMNQKNRKTSIVKEKVVWSR